MPCRTLVSLMPFSSTYHKWLHLCSISTRSQDIVKWSSSSPVHLTGTEQDPVTRTVVLDGMSNQQAISSMPNMSSSWCMYLFLCRDRTQITKLTSFKITSAGNNCAVVVFLRRKSSFPLRKPTSHPRLALDWLRVTMYKPLSISSYNKLEYFKSPILESSSSGYPTRPSLSSSSVQRCSLWLASRLQFRQLLFRGSFRGGG